MNLRSKLLAAGTLFSLVLAPVASSTLAVPAHAGPVVSQVQNAGAATRAADYLSAQFVNGTHLLNYTGAPDAANTADGVLGLMAARSHADTIAAAVAWLQSQAPTVATGAGTSARLAIVAEAMGIDPTSFGGVNLIAKVADNGTGQAGNPYGLALQVIALHRAGVTVPTGIVTNLLAAQDASGAFGFPGYPIDPDSTALSALALSLLTGDQQALDASARAIRWFSANRCDVITTCPAPGAYWNTWTPANTSGLTIGALLQAGANVSAEQTWLIGQQQADGGFPSSGASDAYATAQALLGVTGESLVTVTMFQTSSPSPTPTETPAASTPAPSPSNPASDPSTPASTFPSGKPLKLPRTGSDGSGVAVLGLITIGVGLVATIRIPK